MRFEDQPAGGTPPPPPTPTPADPRRRTPRSWTVPGERFDRPVGDAPPSGRPRRLSDPPPPPPGAGTDLGPLSGLLGDLRAELSQLRTALQATASAGDDTLVTGTELAAIIEGLGTTLGTGMATLLTEHRNLLARDIEGAAVRILEEVSQRLRSSGALVVDGVEERVRHVNAKAMGDTVDQLDLRLDQLQADLAGLRSVMLDIPDQTSVVERLDQLAETVGSSGRGRESARLTPAMSAAIERSVAGPFERLESELDALREALASGLPVASGEGASFPDATALAALTTEMTALRRRISIRTDRSAEAVELSERQLDDLAERIVARMGSVGGGKAKVAAEPAAPEPDAEDEAPAAKKPPAKRASKRRS